MAAAKKTAGAKSPRTRISEAVASGRERLDTDDEIEGIGEAASTYFARMDKSGVQFVPSGAAVFDCMLGGGWALGRIANVVGDRSAGKTLLAIEACANFHVKYPDAPIRYAESEHAFDEAYAEALGMPVDAVEFNPKDKPFRTIEDWYADVQRWLKEKVQPRKDRVGLYVLDSLDALSDDAEMQRDMGEGTFGVNKPKKLAELFRRLVADLEESNVLVIVVSQLRDKIGVMFGEKQTRTGGRALDFYASHIVWLAEIGKIKRKIGDLERVVGVNVRARVKKNKVGLPFRECTYPVIFGYGVDDLTANVEWLLEAGTEDKLRERVGMSKSGYKVRIANLRDKGGAPVIETREKLTELVREEWERVELAFLPKSKKY